MKSGDHNTQNKGLSKKAKEEWINYDGNVYCVTVPNHIIYVRREGIPFWCGNSGRWYLTAGTDEMHKIVSDWEKQTAKICEECGKPGKIRGREWFYTACTKHSQKEDLPRKKKSKKGVFLLTSLKADVSETQKRDE